MKSELCVASRNMPGPAFIPGKPAVCLGMLDGCFRLDKFYYALTALPSDVALEMQDFAIQPPSTEPYTQFRKALTAHTGLTDQQHFQVIFETVENRGFFQ